MNAPQVNVSYKCARCGDEYTHCITTVKPPSADAPLTGMPSFLTHVCPDGIVGVCVPFKVTE
jgi:hypothetical protein